MTPSRHLPDLIALMQRLRTDCPWDAAQTNESLIPYAIEEVYELIDAIRHGSTDDIKGELGDVLLQVVFHAALYEERGEFNMGDVIETLMTKLIRRHPHVFDAENLATEADVKRRWDEIKAIENAGKPTPKYLDKVGPNPVLIQAHAIQKRAAKVGFDWDDMADTFAQVRSEIDELSAVLPMHGQPLSDGEKAAVADELGDCLFALVNVARQSGVSAEEALYGTIAKFRRRFGYIEDSLIAQGQTLDAATLDEMEELWQDAKRQGL